MFLKSALFSAIFFLFILGIIWWSVVLVADSEESSGAGNPIFADGEEIPWKPVEGVEGAKWKVIRTDASTGAITAIVQFPAGAVEAPHHHSKGHMIYVLSGAKVVENLTAKKEFTLTDGMYLYTPAGNVHRIRYLTRCTFLFVTDGPFDMIWDKSISERSLEHGREIFNARCSSCHGIDGQNPKAARFDFRLKKDLTYERILKGVRGRVKNSDSDAEAVAQFIHQLTRSGT